MWILLTKAKLMSRMKARRRFWSFKASIFSSDKKWSPLIACGKRLWLLSIHPGSSPGYYSPIQSKKKKKKIKKVFVLLGIVAVLSMKGVSHFKDCQCIRTIQNNIRFDRPSPLDCRATSKEWLEDLKINCFSKRNYMIIVYRKSLLLFGVLGIIVIGYCLITSILVQFWW